jgi:hypothetical protein
MKGEKIMSFNLSELDPPPQFLHPINTLSHSITKLALYRIKQVEYE